MTATSLRTARKKSGISLTALIDVVFILLMFFMLTSTFVEQQQLLINTPTIGQASTASEQQLLVLHEQGGQTFYNDSAHPIDSWQALPALLHTDQPLVILPEQQVSLAQIIQVMEQLQSAGISTLTLGQSVPAQTPRRSSPLP